MLWIYKMEQEKILRNSILIKRNNMQNVIIKNELKWYEKKANILGIGYGLGIISGIIIMK